MLVFSINSPILLLLFLQFMTVSQSCVLHREGVWGFVIFLWRWRRPLGCSNRGGRRRQYPAQFSVVLLGASELQAGRKRKEKKRGERRRGRNCSGREGGRLYAALWIQELFRSFPKVPKPHRHQHCPKPPYSSFIKAVTKSHTHKVRGEEEEERWTPSSGCCCRRFCHEWL